MPARPLTATPSGSLVYQDFISDGLEGWVVVDANNDGDTWTSNWGATFDSDYDYDNWEYLPSDDWLVSPEFTVGTGYYYWVSEMDGQDVVQRYVLTDGYDADALAAATPLVADGNVVDMLPYAGQTVRVAYRIETDDYAYCCVFNTAVTQELSLLGVHHATHSLASTGITAGEGLCVVAGQPVTLELDMYGTAESYNWTFAGADITYSTAAAPTVTWTEPGYYNNQGVSVSNGVGTEGMTFVVVVVSCDAPGQLPYRWGTNYVGEYYYYGFACWAREGFDLNYDDAAAYLEAGGSAGVTSPTFTVGEPAVLSFDVNNYQAMTLQATIAGNTIDLFTAASHPENTTVYVPLSAYVGQEISVTLTATNPNDWGANMVVYNPRLEAMSLGNLSIAGPQAGSRWVDGVGSVECTWLDEGTFYAFNLEGADALGSELGVQWLCEGADSVIVDPYGNGHSVAVRMLNEHAAELMAIASFGGQTDTLRRSLYGGERSRYHMNNHYIPASFYQGDPDGALGSGYVFDAEAGEFFSVAGATTGSITTMPYHVPATGTTKVQLGIDDWYDVYDSLTLTAYAMTEGGPVALVAETVYSSDEPRFDLSDYKGSDIPLMFSLSKPASTTISVYGVLVSYDENGEQPWIQITQDTVHLSMATIHTVIAEAVHSGYMPQITWYLNGEEVSSEPEASLSTVGYYVYQNPFTEPGTYTLVVRMANYANGLSGNGSVAYDTCIVVVGCDEALYTAPNYQYSAMVGVGQCWDEGEGWQVAEGQDATPVADTARGMLSPAFALLEDVPFAVSVIDRRHGDYMMVVHHNNATDTFRFADLYHNISSSPEFSSSMLSLEPYMGQTVRMELIGWGNATLGSFALFDNHIYAYEIVNRTDTVTYVGNPLALKAKVYNAMSHTMLWEAEGADIVDGKATWAEPGIYTVTCRVASVVDTVEKSFTVEVRPACETVIGELPYVADFDSLEECWRAYKWIADGGSIYRDDTYEHYYYDDPLDTTEATLRSPLFALEADGQYQLHMEVYYSEHPVQVWALSGSTETLLLDTVCSWGTTNISLDLTPWAGGTVAIELRAKVWPQYNTWRLYHFSVEEVEPVQAPGIQSINPIYGYVGQYVSLSANLAATDGQYYYEWQIEGAYSAYNSGYTANATRSSGTNLIVQWAGLNAVWFRAGEYQVRLIVSNEAGADTAYSTAYIANDGCTVTESPYTADLADGSNCWYIYNYETQTLYLASADGETVVLVDANNYLESPYIDLGGEADTLSFESKGDGVYVIVYTYDIESNGIEYLEADIEPSTDWAQAVVPLPEKVIYAFIMSPAANAQLRNLRIGDVPAYDTTHSSPVDTTHTVDTTVVDTIIYNYITVDTTVYNITTVDSVVYNVITVDTVVYNIIHSDSIVYDTVTVTIYDTVYVEINDVEAPADVKIYHADGQIVIEGVQGRTVRLFDAVGRLLATRSDSFDAVRFGVPATGVYLVKVDGCAAKRITLVR